MTDVNIIFYPDAKHRGIILIKKSLQQILQAPGAEGL